MIIDSSVLVAILRLEPGYDRFVLAITQAIRRLLAVPTLLETTMVLAGRRPRCRRPPDLPALWQGPASGGAEFRRLHRLRYGTG